MVDLAPSFSNPQRLEAKIVRLRRDALDRQANHEQFVSCVPDKSNTRSADLGSNSEQLHCSRSPEFQSPDHPTGPCQQQLRRGFRKPKERAVHLRPLACQRNHRSASSRPHISSKPEAVPRRTSSTSAKPSSSLKHSVVVEPNPPGHSVVAQHTAVPHLRLPMLSQPGNGGSTPRVQEVKPSSLFPGNAFASQELPEVVTHDKHNASAFHEALQVVQAAWRDAKAEQTKTAVDDSALAAKSVDRFQPRAPDQSKGKSQQNFRRKHSRVPATSNLPELTTPIPVRRCAEGFPTGTTVGAQDCTRIDSPGELSLPADMKDKSDERSQDQKSIRELTEKPQETVKVLEGLKRHLALRLVDLAYKGELNLALSLVTPSACTTPAATAKAEETKSTGREEATQTTESTETLCAATTKANALSLETPHVSTSVKSSSSHSPALIQEELSMVLPVPKKPPLISAAVQYFLRHNPVLTEEVLSVAELHLGSKTTPASTSAEPVFSMHSLALIQEEPLMVESPLGNKTPLACTSVEPISSTHNPASIQDEPLMVESPLSSRGRDVVSPAVEIEAMSDVDEFLDIETACHKWLEPTSSTDTPYSIQDGPLMVESSLGGRIGSDVMSPVFDIQEMSDDDDVDEGLNMVIKTVYHESLADALDESIEESIVGGALERTFHDARPKAGYQPSHSSRVDPGEALDIGDWLEESMEQHESDEESDKEVQ